MATHVKVLAYEHFEKKFAVTFTNSYVFQSKTFECECDTYGSHKKYILLYQSCNWKYRNC